ncbi:flavin-containing monooxygenase [Qipengyuania atrilutea]|uniref:NAD(P)/FAD-dependent oxidoreductase n=1 Tax=Qipengyuania atrilutea TaxID=2744473 RepID=A0A850H4U6_9SPHN|nr:NAD(P)/FAD-dependent oxidoreductase [Actirhodobacter atriluteus]NVD45527.1 NAD(P)/FAD-dependent oxidoreductase [Actirhodobacter atriluteus]
MPAPDQTASSNSDNHVDVLIVGAGISGIGMAAHMTEKCPDRSYAIIERRADIGGTWDLFRYPGVRSDSDMHTLGFEFEPWTHKKSIADGASILEYLDRIVATRGIRPHIRFSHKVVSADFVSREARWHVVIEADGERTEMTAQWLYLGSGYYDYDEPHDAGIDTSAFGGDILHPQFWPEDYDYTGKEVVVIGSGATGVTLVPAMSEKAKRVTMLQRTPTWMFSRPAKDWFANTLRKFLPEETAYRVTRWKNIKMQDYGFHRARTKPEKMKEYLSKRLRKALGDAYEQKHFDPPYDPWDQRLCLVPDNDLFDALKSGDARIVTDRIASIDEKGVRLESGDFLPADIIVTATGLKLVIAGKIKVSLDGEQIDFAQRYYYKGCMFSNVPNLAAVFGYLNASWTLRADTNADYVCRVLNLMKDKGASLAVPVLGESERQALEEDDIFDFSSGYIQRSKHLMPRNAKRFPWRLNQNYLEDRKLMSEDPVDDGILELAAAADADARRHSEPASAI